MRLMQRLAKEICDPLWWLSFVGIGVGCWVFFDVTGMGKVENLMDEAGWLFCMFGGVWLFTTPYWAYKLWRHEKKPLEGKKV